MPRLWFKFSNVINIANNWNFLYWWHSIIRLLNWLACQPDIVRRAWSQFGISNWSKTGCVSLQIATQISYGLTRFLMNSFSWFLCLWIKWIYLWCRFDNNSKPKASHFCQFDSNFPLRDDFIDETLFSFPISACPRGSNPRTYTELAFFKLNQIMRFRFFNEIETGALPAAGLEFRRTVPRAISPFLRTERLNWWA